MDEGHCGLPVAELVPLAERLLEVTQDLIRTALDLELQDGAVIADRIGETDCIFLSGLHGAERAVAERLLSLPNGTLPWPWINPDKALPWVEQRTGLTFAEGQQAAVRLALSAKVMVITGGPGVGKTTIVNAILRILAAKGMRLLLCAPTGRAAKRMSEATSREARTIHRLLEVDPKTGGFRRGPDYPLDCDLLVIDETSMVDVLLMHALLRAVPDHAALLVVGDVDQLPSVGPGQALADLIGSGAVPVVRLTEVFRQAAKSRIIVNAHRINQGQMPDIVRPDEESDFYYVPADDPEHAVTRIIDLVKNPNSTTFRFRSRPRHSSTLSNACLSGCHPQPLAVVLGHAHGRSPGNLRFPQSLPEFQRLFPDDAACAGYLEKARWSDGFVCPHCQAAGEPFRFANRLGVLRCRKCRRDTGLTVGTVMARSHTPLSVWFWSAYLVSSQTPGMSAVQLRRQLGLSRYETAFQILHKLRAGMVRPDQDRIGGRPGEHVEVDETWVGGRTRGKGRGVHDKVLVASAVEVRQRKPGTKLDKRKGGRYAGRVRLAIVPDRSAESLCGFVECAVVPGTSLVTDDWSGYASLAKRGYKHLAIAERGRSAGRRGVSANHPSRLRQPGNVAERHPSRGQSPAPASLPQRIHLPLQQAVLSVQRLPFPARHRGRHHRTDLRRALLRSLAAPYMLGVW